MQHTQKTPCSHLSTIDERIRALASKFENEEFLVGDPSWFMHQVEGATNKELLAFIASALSYGSRKQFLPKIQSILDACHPDTHQWLVIGSYEALFPDTSTCFYRLYTHSVFRRFLSALAQMVRDHGSIKGYLQHTMTTRDAYEAITLITQWFSTHGSTGIIPKDAKSSCKRLCMFLRWMVRDHSPVDLGLWSDIIDKRTLIIPMDTHVVQEASRLGLLRSRSTSMSSARKLTDKLLEIFPDDPLKGDFALFGLGVDGE